MYIYFALLNSVLYSRSVVIHLFSYLSSCPKFFECIASIKNRICRKINWKPVSVTSHPSMFRNFYHFWNTKWTDRSAARAFMYYHAFVFDTHWTSLLFPFYYLAYSLQLIYPTSPSPLLGWLIGHRKKAYYRHSASFSGFHTLPCDLLYLVQV